MDILDTLKSLNGYWHYEGGKYLAKTDDGKVSDTCLNLGVLTCRPEVLYRAVLGLVTKLTVHLPLAPAAYFQDKNLYVCGFNDSRELAYEVARQLGGTAIWFNDDGKPSCSIPDGSTLLFVTDVISSGGTVQKMINFVEDVYERSGKYLPYVLCLVNTSAQESVEVAREWRGGTASDGCKTYFYLEKEFRIVSLTDVPVRVWDTLLAAEADLFTDDQRASMGFNVMGGLQALSGEELCRAPQK